MSAFGTDKSGHSLWHELPRCFFFAISDPSGDNSQVFNLYPLDISQTVVPDLPPCLKVFQIPLHLQFHLECDFSSRDSLSRPLSALSLSAEFPIK
jgi:hypothetical protein